jgi:hypothetical protein
MKRRIEIRKKMERKMEIRTRTPPAASHSCSFS